MADRVAFRSKLDLPWISAQQIVFFSLFCKFDQIRFGVTYLQPSDRASDESRDIGMSFFSPLVLEFAVPIVGTATLPLGGGDEQIIIDNGQCACVPLGGNESHRFWPFGFGQGLCGLRVVRSLTRGGLIPKTLECASRVEHCDCIQ